MYKTIIVDDEPWLLRGIENSINWNEHGFSIVLSTTDPREAMDYALSHRPDLLITDVNMPEVSGLDVIRSLRARYADLTSIIISGFSEFAYAQEAISLGVYGYILKPIEKAEVAEIIDKLRVQLDQEQARRSERERLLAASFYEDPEMIGRHLSARFEEPIYPYFQVAIGSGMTEDEANHLPMPSESTHTTLHLGDMKYVFSLNTREDVRSFAREQWPQTTSSQACFGLSTWTESIEELGGKFREADAAVSNSFLGYESRVFCHDSAKAQTTRAFIRERVEWLCENRENSKERFRDIPRCFREEGVDIEGVAYFHNLIAARWSYGETGRATYDDLGFVSYDRLVVKYPTIEHMAIFLAELSEGQQTAEQARPSPQDFSVFEKILAYIDENFASTLFLNDIADKFYLNPTYICDLFRRNIGTTFNKYLTRLRMEQAKELLITTDLAVSQIASLSGYNDYCYFSKVFRRAFLAPPTEFRIAAKQAAPSPQ